MCKKLVGGWLYFKKSEYVKMAVISPWTLFCSKLPYEKFKTIKNNIKVEVKMAISGPQTRPRLWCLRGEKKHPEQRPLKVALVCQSAFLIHSFPFLLEVREEVEEGGRGGVEDRV